ncbi:unnamed protein product [Meloidogyne enterolobii]|uniref:Uncharacterized protein n=1 Tax=Meloidogyne enterolobii TaxID=390850 RepID=A0ACB0XND8_MELEN
MASTVSNNKSKLELSVHQVEPAIVVRHIDERVNDNNSNQLKIIQLKGLSERSNPNLVARFVIDQCQPLIPIDKLSELEQLISSIIWRGRSSEIKVSSCGSADIEKLDDYLELLYDEGESKNQGISLLLQLVCETSPSNLPKIVENEPLMGALVRVMKEDARRNFDLAIQVGQLFHRLSQFSPFLPILSRWKIGLLSLQLVEQELRRSEVWRQKVKELSDLNSRRNWESALIKQDLLITVCLQILLNMSEDLRIENKMQRKGLLNLLFNALEHSSSSQLVFIVINFLWKLSQFVENQKNIVNNSGAVIERLISFIPPTTTSNNRPSSSKENETEILFPLFSLLFNCSFELTSRRRMVQCGLVSLLAPYICDFNIALALMYQLSMEEDAKAMIAFTDCISILSNLLFNQNNNNKQINLKNKRIQLIKCLLINIVLEKRNAQLICGTNGQGLDALISLIFEIEKCEDTLTIKIARNIATHEGPTREMFGKWMPKIVENFITKLTTTTENSFQNYIFALECLGICVLIPEVDWLELDQNFEILNFLKNLFEKIFAGELNKFGVINDDLVLQAVMFCGTLASHNLQMAEKVESELLPFVVKIIKTRQEDDEIILQSIFAIICLLSYGGNLAKRLCIEENEESIIGILLSFLHNKNPKICQLCDKALEKAAEISNYWRKRISEEKFCWHNSQWLEMVKQTTTNEQLNNSEYDKLFEDEYILPSGLVLNSEELLKDSEFLNSVVTPIQRR